MELQYIDLIVDFFFVCLVIFSNNVELILFLGDTTFPHSSIVFGRLVLKKKKTRICFGNKQILGRKTKRGKGGIAFKRKDGSCNFSLASIKEVFTVGSERVLGGDQRPVW